MAWSRLAAAALCALVMPLKAAEMPTDPGKPLTGAEVLAASQADEWQTIAPDNLLVLSVGERRVLIELAPDFAPEHVANLRTLASEKYFDGLSIVRVQENYVVQWGDPSEDESARRSLGSAQPKLPAEFDRAWGDLPFTGLPDPDAYARLTGFSRGFPVARDDSADRGWLVHCYGMLGAGRGEAADSSTAAELYVVSGHSPRHLDRNITLLGRVIEGMDALTTLPRGTGPLGFYEKPEQYVRIDSVRLASTLPPEQQPRRERLSTESASFQRWVEARRFRHESWFVNMVGHIEVCNVPLPVREPAGK